MSVPDNAGGDRKLLTLQNMTSQPIKWKLKVSKVKGLRSKETAFVLVFCIIAAYKIYYRALIVLTNLKKLRSWLCSLMFYKNSTLLN